MLFWGLCVGVGWGLHSQLQCWGCVLVVMCYRWGCDNIKSDNDLWISLKTIRNLVLLLFGIKENQKYKIFVDPKRVSAETKSLFWFDQSIFCFGFFFITKKKLLRYWLTSQSSSRFFLQVFTIYWFWQWNPIMYIGDGWKVS